MKRLALALFVLTLASLACVLDFNPPPLSMTPPAVEPSSPPVILMATPTLTIIPPSAVQTETLIPPSPTQTQALPTLTPAGPTLTVAQLRNASFNIMGSDQILRTVQLQDGRFEEGSDPTQPGYISVSLGEKIAFGDLNADGIEDAAITINENYGGTGEFTSVVAILNQAGQPNPVSTAPIDDRPRINELAIRNGEIFIDAAIHGPEDPMCCAAMLSMRFYRLIENTLVLSRLSTQTPEGAEHSIQIDAPANGTEISAPFTVQGSISLTPFEANLVYSIFIQDYQDPVLQASFVINSDGFGGPGTFELPLDLSEFKGPVRVEISDISQADGSYVAINSLYLVVK